MTTARPLSHRDRLDDVGLAEVDDRTGDSPHAEHDDEQVAE